MKKLLIFPLFTLFFVNYFGMKFDAQELEKNSIPKNIYIRMDYKDDNCIGYCSSYDYKFLGCIGDVCQYKFKKNKNEVPWYETTYNVYCDSLEQKVVAFSNFEDPTYQLPYLEQRRKKPLKFTTSETGLRFETTLFAGKEKSG